MKNKETKKWRILLAWAYWSNLALFLFALCLAYFWVQLIWVFGANGFRGSSTCLGVFLFILIAVLPLWYVAVTWCYQLVLVRAYLNTKKQYAQRRLFFVSLAGAVSIAGLMAWWIKTLYFPTLLFVVFVIGITSFITVLRIAIEGKGDGLPKK